MSSLHISGVCVVVFEGAEVVFFRNGEADVLVDREEGVEVPGWRAVLGGIVRRYHQEDLPFAGGLE